MIASFLKKVNRIFVEGGGGGCLEKRNPLGYTKRKREIWCLFAGNSLGFHSKELFCGKQDRGITAHILGNGVAACTAFWWWMMRIRFVH